jgi:hypothetical protein
VAHLFCPAIVPGHGTLVSPLPVPSPAHVVLVALTSSASRCVQQISQASTRVLLKAAHEPHSDEEFSLFPARSRLLHRPWPNLGKLLRWSSLRAHAASTHACPSIIGRQDRQLLPINARHTCLSRAPSSRAPSLDSSSRRRMASGRCPAIIGRQYLANIEGRPGARPR